jgi:Protein of unknown function (DUF1071)
MEYKELRNIDVSKYTEKKNGLTYLSWAWAVDQLLLADPKAHWFYPEFQRWGNGTVMVFCTVVANDIARTAQLPVMDYRNKAIAEPDAFAVNTAMQRCLAKAIALHGIGLYIYNGEDVPPDLGENVTANVETKQAPKVAAPPKPTPAPTKPAGKPVDWQITVADTEDPKAWMESLRAGVSILLQVANKPEDVANIFKNNRSVFDKAKDLDENGYAQIMASFSATKKSLTKE